DPGAVVYDAVAAARSRGIDVVIADTAGRLPTQLHLMAEISRIKRVIAKAEPGAPHEVWLVLDANTGQNALNQVRAFDDALGLTGLILTKLDGTAKGGVVCAIARQRPLPLRFIGGGEGTDDLRPFAADEFVSALLDWPAACPFSRSARSASAIRGDSRRSDWSASRSNRGRCFSSPATPVPARRRSSS